MKFNKVIAMAMLTCALVMTGCQSNEAPKEAPEQKQEQQADEQKEGEEKAEGEEEDQNTAESSEKVDFEKLAESIKGKVVSLDNDITKDPNKGTAKEALEAFNTNDKPKIIVKALTNDKDYHRILEDFQDDFKKIEEAPVDFIVAVREKDFKENTEEAIPSNMTSHVVIIPDDDGLGLGVPEKGMIIFLDKDNKVKDVKGKMSLDEMIKIAEEQK